MCLFDCLHALPTHPIANVWAVIAFIEQDRYAEIYSCIVCVRETGIEQERKESSCKQLELDLYEELGFTTPVEMYQMCNR